MYRITGKDVLNQLKADLIGKDSYRGVTLTYSWLANQFGHISLGFIPTFIVFLFLSKHNPIEKASFHSALYVSIAWLMFETYNFLGPLLTNRHSESKILFVPGKSKYTFPPAWGNIAFDTITDLCFFWFGAFLASILLHYSILKLIILLSLIIILIFPSRYWFLTKMYLQFSENPFQFRLSQWDFKIDSQYKEKVYKFLNNKQEGQHLFVFGGRRSGKSSLAVGLATEYSIKHKNNFYTTAMKLCNLFSLSNEELKDKSNLWVWRNVSLLVIDDINPGDPVTEELIAPEQFLKMINLESGLRKINYDAFKTTNVIWVMGNTIELTTDFQKWDELLKIMGVEIPVLKIDLGFSNAIGR